MLIATLYIVLTYCKSPFKFKSLKIELQIIYLQQKWLFNTFLSMNCRGHKDTGCPDANVLRYVYVMFFVKMEGSRSDYKNYKVR